MHCQYNCTLEQSKQHNNSKCVVSDRELICRAGFYPMHYGGKSQVGSRSVKNSVVRKEDLLANNLSFWRIKNIGNETQVVEIRKKIEKSKPIGQEIGVIFCPKASGVRNLRIDGYQGRIFRVLDDHVTGISHILGRSPPRLWRNTISPLYQT